MPPFTDEPGSRDIYNHKNQTAAAEAKPLAVTVGSKCKRSEAMDLMQLDNYTRELHIQLMLKAEGAGQAIPVVYLRLRVVQTAMQMGLIDGHSLDLTARAPGGSRLVFTKASDRATCWDLIRKTRPYLVM